MKGLINISAKQYTNKEFWINVYNEPIYTSKLDNRMGSPCDSREQANWNSIFLGNLDNKTLYRIHVRLK